LRSSFVEMSVFGRHERIEVAAARRDRLGFGLFG
jgi:hypothetical protein